MDPLNNIKLSQIFNAHDPSKAIRLIFNALDRFVDKLMEKSKDQKLDKLKELIAKARNISKTDIARLKSVLSEIGEFLTSLEQQGIQVPKQITDFIKKMTANRKTALQGQGDPIGEELASSDGEQGFDPLKLKTVDTNC